MSNGAHHPSTFELRAGSFSARDLTVLAFRGRESISRGYRVDIDVAVPSADPAAFESQVLEQPMHLALHRDDAPLRVLHGVCTHVAWRAALDDGRSAYQLRLASRLSLLGRRRTSRIFQDKTVDAIVDLVLEQWRILPAVVITNSGRQSADYAGKAQLQRRWKYMTGGSGKAEPSAAWPLAIENRLKETAWNDIYWHPSFGAGAEAKERIDALTPSMFMDGATSSRPYALIERSRATTSAA